MSGKLSASTPVSALLARTSLVPVTVADAAERKDPAAYPAADLVPGSLTVIQSNLPGILWNLVAADVTQDDSWIGTPFTVDPDGSIIVSMELADVTGTIPEANVLGMKDGFPRLGDGVTLEGNRVSMEPPQPAYKARILVDGSSPLSVIAAQTGTTGITYSVNGATPVHTAVAVDTPVTIVIPVNGAPSEIFIWASSGIGVGSSAKLTRLDLGVGNNYVLHLDVRQVPFLTRLVFPNINARFLDLSNNLLLTHLNIFGGSLTNVTVDHLTALTYLELQNVQSTGPLDLTNLSGLQELIISGSKFTSLDVSGVASLHGLQANSCPLLESADLSGCGEMIAVSFYNCSNLTSFRAVGVFVNYGHHTHSISVSDTGMGAAALNQLYTDLAAGNTFIYVGGTPGAASDDPSIATAKGYTVVGV